MLLRKVRTGRRGGGVALFVSAAGVRGALWGMDEEPVEFMGQD